jgi:hypothetical protein
VAVNVPPVYTGPENPVPAVIVVPPEKAPDVYDVPVVTTSPKLVMVGILKHFIHYFFNVGAKSFLSDPLLYRKSFNFIYDGHD